MFLQPTEERRRLGSDYTPRSLTEPIVRATLEPIVKRLGEHPTPQQILDLKICDPAMGSGAFLVEACRFLGDKLVEAWNHYKALPIIPADEDPTLSARRLVAQRCLYGVDVNRFAVDLAKLSLWLATLAKDHPFTFLDHALRHGDSLVGFSRLQIGQFHWDTSRPHERVFGQEHLEKAIDRVTTYRKEILEMAEDNVASILLKQQKLDLADQTLQNIRRAGDLLVAAYFSAPKGKGRDRLRREYRDLYIRGSRGSTGEWEQETKVVDELRGGRLPIVPFHWEIEFPEVFGRENPGFDAFVGNPPFGGKNTVISSHREGYLPYLQIIHEESHGNADFVCHFFRRCFNLLRRDGTFGLIATNTIAQGDTRASGLRWICTHGGTIYAARKRVKWPGQAAVVVSVTHIQKGDLLGPFDLDGRSVPIITAYLFHAGGHDNPAVLRSNEGKSFIGSYVLGMGFTFDDSDSKGVASPISRMNELIEKNPANASRIFPYLGGEEINDHPTQTHHRYVINFEDWPLRREASHVCWQAMTGEDRRKALSTGVVPVDYPFPVAADYPDLLAIVEEKVKPSRLKDNRPSYRKYWWRYAEKRGELAAAVAPLKQVLCVSQTSKYLAFAFLPTGIVYSHKTVVLATESFSTFAAVQSRPHEIWMLFLGSSLEDRPVYTPSDCFETFPFPTNYDRSEVLHDAGRRYFEFRAGLLVRNQEGLTQTYNRFNDPDERGHDILQLRDLHASMDRAVLDAYGWTDIEPVNEFLLEYEETIENEPRRRKKPWRYRWPNEVRDEVLARLLELNRQRAVEEAIAAEHESGSAHATSPTRKAKRGKASGGTPCVPGLLIEEEQ